MKLHTWTLEGKRLLKALKDLDEQCSDKEMAELCGWSSVDSYKEAILEAQKGVVPETITTKEGGKLERIVPEFYCVINDFLARDIDKSDYVFMTSECAEENYDDSDIIFDDFDEDDEDDKAIMDKYGLDNHVYIKLDRLLYVDAEIVEIDDCLEYYGLKRQHLDPDSPYLQQITIIPD